MKKVIGVVAAAMLAQFIICAGNLFAYSIMWDDLRYYSGLRVDNDWVSETYTNGNLSYGSSDNFCQAQSGNPTLKAQAHATSGGFGNAEALALFYGRLTITDTEPVVFSDITGHLIGSLNGGVVGNAYFDSSVGGGIMIYEGGEGHPTLEAIVGLVHQGNGNPPEEGRLWVWRKDLGYEGNDGFDFSINEESSVSKPYNIDFSDTGVAQLYSDHDYYFLAGFDTSVYANAPSGASAWASSDFYNSFTFDIAQAQTVVPEPASLTLLGLGLLGLLGFKKKR